MRSWAVWPPPKRGPGSLASPYVVRANGHEMARFRRSIDAGWFLEFLADGAEEFRSLVVVDIRTERVVQRG